MRPRRYGVRGACTGAVCWRGRGCWTVRSVRRWGVRRPGPRLGCGAREREP
ncbi:hypothetical protein E1A91_A08G038100v1 [Gossypium mustelinum]|uniref:Uncharacterized protein n=1 Tax=Gossypium mustelinum TaxID=34275 RepID=A0A5D2Y5L4_GOSMU|nr:hypothetical protein E1A91_A08G038100v1 [Gossypium mustelinum]